MSVAAALASSVDPPPPVLEDSSVSSFQRLGWTAAPAFFTDAEMAELADFTHQTLALPEVPGAQMVYRETSLLDPQVRLVQRIENFCVHHAGFDAFIRHGRLVRAVEMLLGGPALLFKDKINFKMPGGAGFEPHQDQQAGWTAYAPLFLTAMVTVDEATEDNGCLELPGCERQHTLIGREWAPLGPEETARLGLTPIPTRPGDVLFFDSFVPHASRPNRTPRQRRILYLTYNLASHGDHRARYYADKRASFPPDIERKPGVDYKFRV